MSSKIISKKPYLIKAILDWVLDNLLTPYVLVDAEVENTLVPRDFINDGKIVFNITPGIVQSFDFTNHVMQFNARFGGKLQHVFIPTEAILAIYAKETGDGMMFDPNEDNEYFGEDTSSTKTEPEKKDDGKSKRSHLKIVE